MMVIGIDAHKRPHTAVTVDEMGRAGSDENRWYDNTRSPSIAQVGGRYGREAVVGDQGLPAPARRLERDLIAAGESVVRVSPKLMAHVRDSARSFGNLIRSTAWRWRGPRCGNRIYRSRASMASSASCGCW